MKKLLTLTLLLSLNIYTYSQGQNWKTNGNTLFAGDYLGSDNNEPLIFKANGNEGLRIKPNGELRIKNFDDNLNTGIVFVNANGILSKLNFTGNANEVLLGSGSFGNISTLSGWSFAGGIASTTGKVVIGNISSTEKLNVDGNILANGSISGTSINVVDIIGAGKEIKILNSLCLKGQDVNIPGSRNMICGMNGDLYVQSTSNNYNTIINYGNTGKVGIGVLPTEKFHVGVAAKFDGGLNFSNLTPATNGDILFIDQTGNVTRGAFNVIAAELYGLECLTDISGNITPYWQNGPWKTFIGGNVCEQDIKVGINTANPSTNLDVIGNAQISGTLKIGTSSIWLGGVDQATGTNNTIYSTTSALLIQSDAANSFNTIINANNNGNVGIGMTNPGHKLEVAGTVRACKFIAEANLWCDFVFADDYKLMTISDMEQYLKSEKHLKYLPSEKEIFEKGVDVVEVYTGLLRHTEENTLYIIQLEKEKLELEKRIMELEKEKVANEEWKKAMEERMNKMEEK